MKTKQFHKLANIFPMLSTSELASLADDIKQNDLQDAIWLYEDKIIDGRNRYLACQIASVEPVYREYRGGSPVSFIVSANLKRRHLSKDQLSCIGAEIEPMLAEEAKKRQLAALKQGDKCPVREESPEREKGRARDHAAAIVGVKGRSVSDAKSIMKASPGLYQDIKQGKITIAEANREIKRAEVLKKVAKLPSKKYRVVYADPPWKYSSSSSGLDQYGPAERHYPAMAISDLCALDIKGIVNEDAVLFIWVTSPILAECWPVICDWGFKYKSSFVWDKVGHNYGHYNSVRHELLLICTRGSCLPDTKELIDSVVEVPKSNKHSEKPERFRKIIDQLYPHGKRIELFARTKVKNWDSYGKES